MNGFGRREEREREKERRQNFVLGSLHDECGTTDVFSVKYLFHSIELALEEPRALFEDG